ncbi:MAG: hypothetical protein BGO31_19355 [Bacteroidetes bacterium 43-16]|nr:MAG: hypothetical protein BGO31_19355 [Bacteroidetes bacterium 43-16]
MYEPLKLSIQIGKCSITFSAKKSTTIFQYITFKYFILKSCQSQIILMIQLWQPGKCYALSNETGALTMR